MGQYRLTSNQEQSLRDQEFGADRPGTVLGDFQRMVDFLETREVESSGKHNLLPLKLIDELDRQLSRPLHLALKRPLIRSHPYLHGLNLLLRASELMRVDQRGARAWLVVDPEMKIQWDHLNPTERYFNLLEAWLLIGRAEMIGAVRSRFQTTLSTSLQCWQSLSREAYRSNLDNLECVYLPGIDRESFQAALMDLFGLVELVFPPRPITPWCPAGIKLLPFGDAIFALLATGIDHTTRRFYEMLAGVEKGDDEDDEEEDDDDDDRAEIEDEDEWEEPSFGTWQPLFQPFFPEWRSNLRAPRGETREGTLVFRVSLGKIWRVIAMPASATLEDLVGWVLRSVKFDRDHLYRFTYRDRLGREVNVNQPDAGEGPWTDQTTLGKLPLRLGDSMDLLYDFGDDWLFAIRLERVEPPTAKAKAPRILEKHGKSPEQYPSWDD